MVHNSGDEKPFLWSLRHRCRLDTPKWPKVPQERPVSGSLHGNHVPEEDSSIELGSFDARLDGNIYLGYLQGYLGCLQGMLPSVPQLHYDSVLLLTLALKAARSARADRDARGASSLQDDALTAILLSAAATEAFINELPEHVRIHQGRVARAETDIG